MALINCPECGGKVSDKAPACIHCGFPLSELITTSSTTDEKEILQTKEYSEEPPIQYQLVLTTVNRNYEEKTIQTIKELLGIDIPREKLSDNPCIILTSRDREKCKTVQTQLLRYGAVTEIRRDTKKIIPIHPFRYISSDPKSVVVRCDNCNEISKFPLDYFTAVYADSCVTTKELHCPKCQNAVSEEYKLTKPDMSIQEPQYVSLAKRPCNKCGTMVITSCSVCPQCGNIIEKNPPRNINLIKCPSCRKEVSKTARSCPNCGHLIDTKVYCPKCGSSDTKVISGASKTASIVVWGILAANKVISKYQCKKCGHIF